MSYSVRPGFIGDIAQLEEIEKDGFPTSWPMSSFRRDLQDKKKSVLVVYQDCGIGSPEMEHTASKKAYTLSSGLSGIAKKLITLIGGSSASYSKKAFIAGYISTWFISDEAHITAIAVREPKRGVGLGELLLMNSVDQAIRNRAQMVTLEVRVSNITAQSLYQKYGFKYVGVRKRYYTDNNEDAHIMTTDNISTASYSQMLAALRVSYKRKRGDLGLTLGQNK